jgi:hypothetical protein
MITHVAIIKDGKTYSLPKPNRHNHVIAMMVKEYKLKPPCSGEEQGFLIDGETFVNREEAAKIAIASGQIKKLTCKDELFSEDLW